MFHFIGVIFMSASVGKLFFDPGPEVFAALIKEHGDSISHRGLTNRGYFHLWSLGLGLRRLSIIDLAVVISHCTNEDGSIHIVFDGEIYNYTSFADTWWGTAIFQDPTDTETIVHLYEQLGEACVEKLRGMFAFAHLDVSSESTLSRRDRVELSPCITRNRGTPSCFASEDQSILADPEMRRNRTSMIDRFYSPSNYLPGEETLFKNSTNWRRDIR